MLGVHALAARGYHRPTRQGGQQLPPEHFAWRVSNTATAALTRIDVRLGLTARANAVGSASDVAAVMQSVHVIEAPESET